MRPVPTTPVFTRADLRALGWSDEAIGRAIRAGRLVRVRRGILTTAVVDARVTAIAAATAVADSAVSDRTALLLHRLPDLGPVGTVPLLTVGPTGRGSAHGAHLFRAQLRPHDIVLVDGVPVTSIARTLIDVARHRPILASVAAIDAALHARRVTAEELDDVVRFCATWPRIARALRALRLVDARSESPLESVSRVVMHWLGVPRPELQVVILDADGRFLGRSDFYWDGPGVVGEADGRSKYDARDVLTEEKTRQEGLEDPGLVVTRWGWAYPTGRRAAFVRKLERAFRRGYLRDRSGLPRQWSVRPS